MSKVADLIVSYYYVFFIMTKMVNMKGLLLFFYVFFMMPKMVNMKERFYKILEKAISTELNSESNPDFNAPFHLS